MVVSKIQLVRLGTELITARKTRRSSDLVPQNKVVLRIRQVGVDLARQHEENVMTDARSRNMRKTS